MKLVLRKHRNALIAVDQDSMELLSKIKDGDWMKGEWRKSRNPAHHRKFWALLGKVHENVDHSRYPTVDDLATALKISAGHRTTIILPDGSRGFIAKSIAFDKMDQHDFNEFYKTCVDLICRNFLPGLEDGLLKREIEEMVA